MHHKSKRNIECISYNKFTINILFDHLIVTRVLTVCWCLLETLCLLICKMKKIKSLICNKRRSQHKVWTRFSSFYHKIWFLFFFQSLAFCIHDISGLNCPFIFKFPANNCKKLREQNKTLRDTALVCLMGIFKTTKYVLISLFKSNIYFCPSPQN